jgi:hypothetical protein
LFRHVGAGPEPIPYKELTAEKLAGAINQALKPDSLDKAKLLADKISREKGSQNGAQSFHQMLKVDELRCAVAPMNTAVWRVKRTQVVLSAKAATVLAQEGELSFSELKLYVSLPFYRSYANQSDSARATMYRMMDLWTQSLVEHPQS